MTSQELTMTTNRLMIAPLLAGLLIGATGALASDPLDACCACFADRKAMQSGPPMQPPVPALFCGEFSSRNERQAADVQCSGLGGELECLEEEEGTSRATISAECREALLDQDVACPQQAGAPLAGPWALAGLAAALGALGAAARRRR
jgi:hypothetical protein